MKKFYVRKSHKYVHKIVVYCLLKQKSLNKQEQQVNLVMRLY